MRFDRGFSLALNLLGMVGWLGVAAWALFLLAVLLGVLRLAISPARQSAWLSALPLAAAWLALVVAAFLSPLNITLIFWLFFFSGLLAAAASPAHLEKTFRESPVLAMLGSLLFVIASVVMVSVIFITLQRYFAEAAFARAVRLDASGGSLNDVVIELDKAAQFNRFNDIYYRNLSHALLLRVGEELQAGSGEEQMSAERLQFIQALTGAAINASVRATELSPSNALNWLSRATLYRELVPLVGKEAEDFSLAAGQKALELEPNNPENYLEIGKTYVYLAQSAYQLAQDQQGDAKSATEAAAADWLKQAESAFQKATELKADYAPAHYQLALVYQQQDRLDDAISKMESVARANQMDVGVAFQLGLLYLRRSGEGDLERAENAFGQAVTLAPSYSDAHWFLASIYEQRKEFDKAIEQVEKVLELNPDNELVKTRLERLKEGKAAAELPVPVDEGEGGAVELPAGQPDPVL